MKKMLIMMAVLLTPLFCGTALGAGGSLAGSGTRVDPYLIEDLADFDVFASNSFYWQEGVYSYLYANLDFAGRVYDTALIASDQSADTGFQGQPYRGIFNGNGYQIIHLTIDAANTGNNYLGLFGKVDGDAAHLRYIQVVDSSITGDSVCAGGICAENSATISECRFSGTIQSNSTVGGICGTNNGTIQTCFTEGAIISSVGSGGICGYIDRGVIRNCYSTSSLSGSLAHGGICGKTGYYYEISECYFTGYVTGGGIGGDMDGWMSTSRINNSYWDINTTGTDVACHSLAPTPGGRIYVNLENLEGKTTAEMQDISTYLSTGWDFTDEDENGNEDVWFISGNDYPRLTWQLRTRPDNVDVVFTPDLAYDYAFWDQAANWSTNSIPLNSEDLVYDVRCEGDYAGSHEWFYLISENDNPAIQSMYINSPNFSLLLRDTDFTLGGPFPRMLIEQGFFGVHDSFSASISGGVIQANPGCRVLAGNNADLEVYSDLVMNGGSIELYWYGDWEQFSSLALHGSTVLKNDALIKAYSNSVFENVGALNITDGQIKCASYSSFNNYGTLDISGTQMYLGHRDYYGPDAVAEPSLVNHAEGSIRGNGTIYGGITNDGLMQVRDGNLALYDYTSASAESFFNAEYLCSISNEGTIQVDYNSALDLFHCDSHAGSLNEFRIEGTGMIELAGGYLKTNYEETEVLEDRQPAQLNCDVLINAPGQTLKLGHKTDVEPDIIVDTVIADAVLPDIQLAYLGFPTSSVGAMYDYDELGENWGTVILPPTLQANKFVVKPYTHLILEEGAEPGYQLFLEGGYATLPFMNHVEGHGTIEITGDSLKDEGGGGFIRTDGGSIIINGCENAEWDLRDRIITQGEATVIFPGNLKLIGAGGEYSAGARIVAERFEIPTGQYAYLGDPGIGILGSDEFPALLQGDLDIDGTLVVTISDYNGYDQIPLVLKDGVLSGTGKIWGLVPGIQYLWNACKIAFDNIEVVDPNLLLDVGHIELRNDFTVHGSLDMTQLNSLAFAEHVSFINKGELTGRFPVGADNPPALYLGSGSTTRIMEDSQLASVTFEGPARLVVDHCSLTENSQQDSHSDRSEQMITEMSDAVITGLHWRFLGKLIASGECECNSATLDFVSMEITEAAVLNINAYTTLLGYHDDQILPEMEAFKVDAKKGKLVVNSAIVYFFNELSDSIAEMADNAFGEIVFSSNAGFIQYNIPTDSPVLCCYGLTINPDVTVDLAGATMYYVPEGLEWFGETGKGFINDGQYVNGEILPVTVLMNFDMNDFSEFSLSWGSREGDEKYNSDWDLFTDGQIDYLDLSIFAENWLSGL